MSWSAPWDAMDRNAPPITPPQSVYGDRAASARSMTRSFPAAAACARMAGQPPSTDRAEQYDRRDPAHEIDAGLEHIRPDRRRACRRGTCR